MTSSPSGTIAPSPQPPKPGSYRSIGPKENQSDRIHPLSRVAETLDSSDSEAVDHAQEEVRHRLAAGLEVATGLERPSAGPGQDDGEVVVVVAVAVAVPASVDDHRI